RAGFAPTGHRDRLQDPPPRRSNPPVPAALDVVSGADVACGNAVAARAASSLAAMPREQGSRRGSLSRWGVLWGSLKRFVRRSLRSGRIRLVLLLGIVACVSSGPHMFGQYNDLSPKVAPQQGDKVPRHLTVQLARPANVAVFLVVPGRGSELLFP